MFQVSSCRVDWARRSVHNGGPNPSAAAGDGASRRLSARHRSEGRGGADLSRGSPVNAERGAARRRKQVETVKGSVLLELQDGSQVLIKAHSKVVLKSPNEGKGFFLELLLGRTLVKVQKRVNETPSFRMGTPSAVITVRGTRFEVEVNRKQKTYVDVFEGIVEVEGLVPGARHVLIQPGFFSGVNPDRAPEEPRDSSPGDGAETDNAREGQNSGIGRSSGDQERNQNPPKQGGSEGKPD